VAAFLKSFKPDECLYLFEPAGDKQTEPMVLAMKTIATVSPLAKQIKEFLKAGNTWTLYMPTWSEGELLAVARYLREKREHDKSLQQLCSEDAVKARFAKYGGIYRYVLPTTEGDVEKNKNKFDAAMQNVPERILARQGLDKDDPHSNVSHFHLQYNVDETTYRKFTLVLPNEQTKAAMRKALAEANFDELKLFLAACNIGILTDEAPRALERITPMLWERGAEWKVVGGNTEVAVPRKLTYRDVHIDNVPRSWRELRKNELQRVGLVNLEFAEGFARVDFVQEVEEGKEAQTYEAVLAYQDKAGVNATSPNVYHAYKLRQRLGMSGTDKMHVFYITLSHFADAWAKKLSGENVWKEPKSEDYKKIPREITDQYEEIKKNTTLTVMTYDFDQ